MMNESNNFNIKYCTDCKTTKTPLWRGGPAGPKSLCNACGIRHRKKKRVIESLNRRPEKRKDKTSHNSTNTNSPTTATTTASASAKKITIVTVTICGGEEEAKMPKKKEVERGRTSSFLFDGFVLWHRTKTYEIQQLLGTGVVSCNSARPTQSMADADVFFIPLKSEQKPALKQTWVSDGSGNEPN
ncbi:hypothetical protein Patl1_22292 [Pistacia atlantica]|uniref:Uncharacterized protein n=1 Tax=Pistacia atlantica TaxID=434234 RepID=A0ACC1A1Y1_9ROSI|nr:hypothetical protein Patl1_22292 [Pistacia atlantica]